MRSLYTGKLCKLLGISIIGALLLEGFSSWEEVIPSSRKKNIERLELPDSLKEKREELIDAYEERTPKEWGTSVSEVVTGIRTEKQKIALTLDACGGPKGNGYDRELIEFLKEEEIAATLFMNSRWIEEHKKIFQSLADHPLFEIANHGRQHKPLSVAGRSAYGIEGTQGVQEVVNEVLLNRQKIKKIIGKKTAYFRAGTAHYDELAVDIVNELGAEVIGYDIPADGGGDFSKKEVKNALLQAEPGSIILAHMNQPLSETFEGFQAALPELKEKGYEFVLLSDHEEAFIEKD